MRVRHKEGVTGMKSAPLDEGRKPKRPEMEVFNHAY